VQLINEAKLKLKLKLLVYPSVVINYGNPNVSFSNNNNNNNNDLNNFQAMQRQQLNDEMQQRIMNNSNSYNEDLNKSMPDLMFQPQPLQAKDYANRNVREYSKNSYKSKKSSITQHGKNEYDNVYAKNHLLNESTFANNKSSMSKSVSSLYAATSNSINGLDNTAFLYNLNKSNQDLLRPAPRLCKIFKNDQLHLQSAQASPNIGFGVQTRAVSSVMPNYLRVSLVNYKSPAYLSGLDAGDFIVEVNGRNTMSMSHEEVLHFIKSSYDHNAYVNLLVLSEFCYNWLKEHDLLSTITTEDRSVFSYADYLKNNHRYVPRLCKIKLFPFSKTFGFSLETLYVRPSVSANKEAKYQSYAHIVIRVEKDSPAYVSNLQKGDRIIECDGINVEAENEKEITDRIYQAFVSAKQITLFVVDPDTDNFFKSKCIKLHSMLPIVQHITNSTDI
jgi:C-terminal processing protease CtpA/Prc